MPATVQSLIADYREAGRVCPYMERWNDLWLLLPNRRQDAVGIWEPPLPLILGAWFTTSNAEKRERFEEHLRWADSNGALEQVAVFLEHLSEDQWLTEPRTS